jgi:RNA polymerase sigma factor (sigma-70 family)
MSVRHAFARELRVPELLRGCRFFFDRFKGFRASHSYGARNREARLDERWGTLYEQCRLLLYRSAALMVGTEEAEEVVQETFERAMREADFFDRVREPVAWLRTVAARQALGRLRRRRIWESLRLGLAIQVESPAWEHAELALALRKLPPRDRVALVLRYYHDAS